MSLEATGSTSSADVLDQIFFLDLSGGRILSARHDGSDLRTIVSEGRKLLDGLAADPNIPPPA